jgi:hypothetical protein
LEKFLTGKVLTRADDPGDTPVFDFHDVLPAALAIFAPRTVAWRFFIVVRP